MGISESKASKLDLETVDELVHSVCNAFAFEFSIAFKDCVVESLRHNEREFGRPSLSVEIPGDGDVELPVFGSTTFRQVPLSNSDFRLLQAPAPSVPLKSGPLMKLGDHVKSWRLRYFVALNAVDNFDIVYSVDEGGRHIKGRISCGGLVLLILLLNC